MMVGYRHTFPEGTALRMQELIAGADSLEALRRYQCIYFRAALGMMPSAISAMTGLSVGTVRNVHSAYFQEGEAALECKERGGRHRAYLSPSAEASWLKDTFEAKALKGGILEVSAVKKAFEAKIKKEVHISTVYDLLHRHGWRKITPRPKHPKADTEAQTAFKKTGRSRSTKPGIKPKLKENR